MRSGRAGTPPVVAAVVLLVGVCAGDDALDTLDPDAVSAAVVAYV